MSKGNIISDIKREEKESRKTKLAATTKVFFPYSITGQWLRSIEDKREDRALWRTASVILAILIPHYDAPPHLVIQALSDHEWSARGEGVDGTLIILKRDFSRFRRGLSWRDASKRKRYTTTPADPQRPWERNVRLNDILSAQLLTRCTAIPPQPRPSFYSLDRYSGHGYVTIASTNFRRWTSDSCISARHPAPVNFV